MSEVAVYSAIGAKLTHHRMDASAGTLQARETIELPVPVQYGWRHATKPFIYMACSDGGPGRAGATHALCVLRMQPDGAVSLHGAPQPLRSRPVHLSLDPQSRFVLLAYNDPSGVSVHRIAEDGSLAQEVPQGPLALGKVAHQVLVTPDGGSVLVPVRGSDARGEDPEVPGGLHVFDFRDGVLTARQLIAPDAGFGFGPRHLDFHPGRPWAYMSIERQNQIALFELGARVDGPKYRTTTLAHPQAQKPRQLVGAIHVHPLGRFVYVSNRADGTVPYREREVFNGAENTIAVYRIDASSGEPTLIQTEDTRGMHVRTFAIDPSGTLLVAGCMKTRDVREGERLRSVPGGLSVFRIHDDGRLSYLRKYDADVSAAFLFWMGMFALPRG